MPGYTDFIPFILPEFDEFVDHWHEPVNQNWEMLNDWLSELYKGLVQGNGAGAWTALSKNKPSLADRLDVSIDADGFIILAGSPDIANMAASATRGQYDGPRERLDDNDAEIYDARQPVSGGRGVPVPIAGPAAGFPPERIDSGIALRSADFGANSGRPISGPHIPWSPGLVIGGANPLITGVGIGRVRITADTPPAIFNIDGYIFRLREVLDFDWNTLAPTNNYYVWLYVERTDSGYNNNGNFKYTAPAGPAAAAKDLRKLQSGSDGITSGSTFSSAAAAFSTAAFGKVKEGDVLVVDGTAAGSYVVDDASDPNQLTIKGIFKADVGSLNWYVLDVAHPNIGAFVTDADPTTLPDYADGRVYFARVKHQTGDKPIEIKTFAAGGVYDSGWIGVDASTNFPKNLIHLLGVPPSDVTIQFRVDASSNRVYPAIVQRQLVTSVDEGDVTLDPGDTKYNTFLVPSAYYDTSELELYIRLLNASTDPAKPSALFTDSGGNDHTTGEMRVIARR